MKISVSIIIPCYNYGKYIEEAVESVLKQTFRDFEIIIVNDGSTDETTLKVLKKIKKNYPEITVIDQKNGGLANARNNGIKAARGEFILPLDADDTIEPTMLEKCHNEIIKDEKLGNVYTYVRFFGDENRIWEIPEYNFYELIWGNYIVATNLFRKKAWEEVGGYDENMKNGYEDWEFLIRLGEHGWQGKLIKEPLFNYRKHGKSMIDDTNKKAESIIRGIREKNSKIYTDEKILEMQRLRLLIDNEKFIIQQKEIAIQQKDHELQQRDAAIQQKDQEVQNKNQELQQKDQEIQVKIQELQQKDQELLDFSNIIQQRDREINFITSSKFWKLRNRYVKLKGLKFSYFVEIFKKSMGVLKRDGIFVFIKYLLGYILHGREYFQREMVMLSDYQRWIQKNENHDIDAIKKEIEEFAYKPKISIITPVYNVDPKWLDKCIESVKNQFYENWELCLHDDASTKKGTIDCLKKWGKADKRIKISFGKENQHISGASNEALKLATGEFIALLDNDDELSPNALYENVKVLNNHPEANLIYSDEDKLEMDGTRSDPFFKPNWSLDLFLSMNYICHLGVYRKKIIDEIGGFRKSYEGSQDYDLILRFIEKTKPERIFHIPKVLYHWRKIPGSTADKFDYKNYANDAAKKALAEYLERNNIKGKVLDGVAPGLYRIKREIIGNPKVSIIIPFKDQAEILERCVDSIIRKTIYKNYEIILVNNQSEEKNTFEYLDKIKTRKNIKILNYDKPFNFSAINNFAVKNAGEFILFLNNDMEVISDSWLCNMLEHIQRKEVGAVGAKLFYPNNTIQHAGVVMGLGIAGHPFKHLPSDTPGNFGLVASIRNYCAVTGACLLTKKELFEKIGGFDEKNLPVAYNDVDLCLRIVENGDSVVYTPYAELYHYESLSRGSDNEDELKFKNPEKYARVISERKYMDERWKKYIDNDPYYSPNLTRTREDFSFRLE